MTSDDAGPPPAAQPPPSSETGWSGLAAPSPLPPELEPEPPEPELASTIGPPESLPPLPLPPPSPPLLLLPPEPLSVAASVPPLLLVPPPSPGPPPSAPASGFAGSHAPPTHVSPGGQLSVLPVTLQPGTHLPAGACDVSHSLPVFVPQSLSWAQPHCSLLATHTGWSGSAAQTEALVDEHWVHSPASAPEVWHAGSCAVGQLSGGGLLAVKSLVQPTHAWPKQMGTGAAQSAFELHPTHVPLIVLHTGTGPVHCDALPAEHCVHAPASAPEVWQAGVGTAQSPSLAQGPQVCVVVLHTGVVPEQFAFVEHWTHVLVVPVSAHTGVAAGQSVFAPHWAHCPACVPPGTQTGASDAAVHSAFDPHARHVSVVAPPDLSQTGVFVSGEPSHWASETQATHAPARGSPAGAQ